MSDGSPNIFCPSFQGPSRRYQLSEFGLPEDEKFYHPRILHGVEYDTVIPELEEIQRAEPRRPPYRIRTPSPSTARAQSDVCADNVDPVQRFQAIKETMATTPRRAASPYRTPSVSPASAAYSPIRLQSPSFSQSRRSQSLDRASSRPLSDLSCLADMSQPSYVSSAAMAGSSLRRSHLDASIAGLLTDISQPSLPSGAGVGSGGFISDISQPSIASGAALPSPRPLPDLSGVACITDVSQPSIGSSAAPSFEEYMQVKTPQRSPTPSSPARSSVCAKDPSFIFCDAESETSLQAPQAPPIGSPQRDRSLTPEQAVSAPCPPQSSRSEYSGRQASRSPARLALPYISRSGNLTDISDPCVASDVYPSSPSGLPLPELSASDYLSNVSYPTFVSTPASAARRLPDLSQMECLTDVTNPSIASGAQPSFEEYMEIMSPERADSPGISPIVLPSVSPLPDECLQGEPGERFRALRERMRSPQMVIPEINVSPYISPPQRQLASVDPAVAEKYREFRQEMQARSPIPMEGPIPQAPAKRRIRPRLPCKRPTIMIGGKPFVSRLKPPRVVALPRLLQLAGTRDTGALISTPRPFVGYLTPPHAMPATQGVFKPRVLDFDECAREEVVERFQQMRERAAESQAAAEVCPDAGGLEGDPVSRYRALRANMEAQRQALNASLRDEDAQAQEVGFPAFDGSFGDENLGDISQPQLENISPECIDDVSAPEFGGLPSHITEENLEDISEPYVYAGGATPISAGGIQAGPEDAGQVIKETIIERSTNADGEVQQCTKHVITRRDNFGNITKETKETTSEPKRLDLQLTPTTHAPQRLFARGRRLNLSAVEEEGSALEALADQSCPFLSADRTPQARTPQLPELTRSDLLTDVSHLSIASGAAPSFEEALRVRTPQIPSPGAAAEPSQVEDISVPSLESGVGESYKSQLRVRTPKKFTSLEGQIAVADEAASVCFGTDIEVHIKELVTNVKNKLEQLSIGTHWPRFGSLKESARKSRQAPGSVPGSAPPDMQRRRSRSAGSTFQSPLYDVGGGGLVAADNRRLEQLLIGTHWPRFGSLRESARKGRPALGYAPGSAPPDMQRLRSPSVGSTFQSPLYDVGGGGLIAAASPCPSPRTPLPYMSGIDMLTDVSQPSYASVPTPYPSPARPLPYMSGIDMLTDVSQPSYASVPTPYPSPARSLPYVSGADMITDVSQPSFASGARPPCSPPRRSLPDISAGDYLTDVSHPSFSSGAVPSFEEDMRVITPQVSDKSSPLAEALSRFRDFNLRLGGPSGDVIASGSCPVESSASEHLAVGEQSALSRRSLPDGSGSAFIADASVPSYHSGADTPCLPSDSSARYSVPSYHSGADTPCLPSDYSARRSQIDVSQSAFVTDISAPSFASGAMLPCPSPARPLLNVSAGDQIVDVSHPSFASGATPSMLPLPDLSGSGYIADVSHPSFASAVCPSFEEEMRLRTPQASLSPGYTPVMPPPMRVSPIPDECLQGDPASRFNFIKERVIQDAARSPQRVIPEINIIPSSPQQPPIVQHPPVDPEVAEKYKQFRQEMITRSPAAPLQGPIPDRLLLAAPMRPRPRSRILSPRQAPAAGGQPFRSGIPRLFVPRGRFRSGIPPPGTISGIANMTAPPIITGYLTPAQPIRRVIPRPETRRQLDFDACAREEAVERFKRMQTVAAFSSQSVNDQGAATVCGDPIARYRAIRERLAPVKEMSSQMTDSGRGQSLSRTAREERLEDVAPDMEDICDEQLENVTPVLAQTPQGGSPQYDRIEDISAYLATTPQSIEAEYNRLDDVSPALAASPQSVYDNLECMSAPALYETESDNLGDISAPQFAQSVPTTPMQMSYPSERLTDVSVPSIARTPQRRVYPGFEDMPNFMPFEEQVESPESFLSDLQVYSPNRRCPFS